MGGLPICRGEHRCPVDKNEGPFFFAHACFVSRLFPCALVCHTSLQDFIEEWPCNLERNLKLRTFLKPRVDVCAELCSVPMLSEEYCMQVKLLQSGMLQLYTQQKMATQDSFPALNAAMFEVEGFCISTIGDLESLIDDGTAAEGWS